MFHRILRVATTLATVVVAYQLYVLVAVPWLEPRVEARQQRVVTAADVDRGRQLVNKYQSLLSAYFPADHWCQQRAPIVIRSGQLMLVLDEYRQLAGRQIELERLAVLFFPTDFNEGQAPPRDAVIVEVPGGASFTFDEDFNPATSKTGRVQSGQLEGPIVIRSDMHEPGPQDDLLVETRDLKLDKNRLETFAEVEFQLGNSSGSGRQLEMRFLPDPNGAHGGAAAQFDRLQSLEILHDVRCQIDFDSEKLLPDEGTTGGEKQASEQPVQINCAGSFEFVFVAANEKQADYVATFHDDVQVWQFNPAGQSDTMTCSKLSLEFSPGLTDADRLPLDGAQRQREEFGRLRPYVLDAVGEPVILLSPSRQFEARGLHLRITLPERRISLDGGNVRMTSETNVLRAAAISYTHPADDADTRIGSFRAQGEGSLDFAPSPSKPDELLRVEWRDSVYLSRDEDQPVLTIRGRPRLAMNDRGQLMADQMKIFLRELPGESAAVGNPWLGPQLSSGSDDSTVLPDRLSARGNVVIDSPQLTGQTHELAAWFNHQPEEQGDQQPDDAPESGRFHLPGREDTQESYAIQADMLRLEIDLRNRKAVPVNLSCDGHVVFRESRTRNADEAPLVLHGQRLTVEDIDSGAARIAVLGDEAEQDGGAASAEMSARGVTLISRAVYVDEGENRAWIDGKGEAQMRMDRDLQGGQVSAPYMLTVRWREGLEFDGERVELRGDVFAEGPDDWLRCDRLIGTLSQPVSFGEQVAREAIELAEIDCRGQVVIDHRGRDETGPTSHQRMELEQLAINQQTGAIDGSGPGSVRSVHYGEEFEGTTGDQTADDGGQRLHFLRVGFNRGIAGNLHDRELTFQGRVRTVYGPVDAWEQEIDPDGAAGMPPGAVSLRCNELTVNEDPTYRSGELQEATANAGLALGGAISDQMGPKEMHARGNVRIETGDDENQAIEATAQRASYDEIKDLFVLEGSATIRYKRQVGGPTQQGQADKIMYHRRTGEIQVNGFSGGDFSSPASAAFAPIQNRVAPVAPPR